MKIIMLDDAVAIAFRHDQHIMELLERGDRLEVNVLSNDDVVEHVLFQLLGDGSVAALKRESFEEI